MNKLKRIFALAGAVLLIVYVCIHTGICTYKFACGLGSSQSVYSCNYTDSCSVICLYTCRTLIKESQ